MNGSILLPSIGQLKQQAKRLRTELEAIGTTTGHSKSLEMLAHQHGYKDWNTLHGAVENRPAVSPVSVGDRVTGNYLGQTFSGEVKGVQAMVSPGRYRVTIGFDNAVDVITFEGLSNFRRRVTCVIGMDGKTIEKTSNGKPQLALDLGGVTH